jgi:hypothetical protein
MKKIAGSISQRHGSADPNPDPDPHQNVMDPQHCGKGDPDCSNLTKKINTNNRVGGKNA